MADIEKSRNGAAEQNGIEHALQIAVRRDNAQCDDAQYGDAQRDNTQHGGIQHNGAHCDYAQSDGIYLGDVLRDSAQHDDARRDDKLHENAEKTALAYKRLYETIRILRAPGGCPWDREQTPLSMRRDLIEEVFEAVDAISEGDAAHAKEELGDVLLNATMIAYMHEQQHDFSVADALNELTEKLIRRHPHVFPESEGKIAATGNVQTGEEVLAQWDAIKANVEKRTGDSVLDDVPKGFPPLLRAYKLQKKAAKKGFDWQDIRTVREKVFEELAEVADAVQRYEAQQCTAARTCTDISPCEAEHNAAQLHVEEEVGDAFFALVNYARHLGVDPEIALSHANKKFYRRFSYVEAQCRERNIPMDNAHLEDEDALWNEAKQKGL